ncbi:hypothetical protein N7460_004387 [Penicillium canescens]|uniref:Zn(2)-C6 fungal-type domain-containing protein n=2 Tax=Penicillium canescens TaxID=5083 RepID=A0AAD6N8N4_PENCN|nr:hypothetical protein N7460_004387 [Penicillium canescens]KAJ6177621.1 hypothetical protein N7485_004535 [Penicillium canescens]
MATPRRNGQLSSCEPCRTSKLRCDHTSPVCGRCSRRGLHNRCIYHPAPLTNQVTAIHPKKKKRCVAHGTDTLNISSSPTNEKDGWTQKKFSVSAPGFLGQTSYSDVFTDTRSGLPAEALSLGGHDTVPVDTKRVHLGAQVLALLENLPFYRDLVTARFKIWKGWTIGWPITNMVFTVVEEMWNDPDYDGMDLCQQTLLMSKKLFETHARPLEVRPSMSWEDFKSASFGRWEVIGLLFILTGITTDWISHDDPIFTRQGAMDAKRLAITATAVGDTCLQFCDSSGIINDIVSWLLLHQTSLLAIVYGESDFRPWRKLGELSTTVFALGLHQDSSANTPFFLAEMRKRTMVAAYTVDKVLATFLGRPPLISWRYCDIQMPLDLSVEEIFADPPFRDAAIRKLDKHTGWNQEASLMKGAWPRVAFVTSVLREKVLELSLSCRTSDLSHRVENLSHESRQERQLLPEFLHWNPDSDGSVISRVEEDLLFEVHMEFLYNDFLLYRTLAQRTETEPEAIIDISREILSAVILMVSKKIRSGHSLNSHIGNMCLPGLPSAGVLSVELLRQTRPTPRSTALNLPRSEIIQNLTLFASYLDAIIAPHDGNYRVAQQGQRAIRHVLNQVLSVNSGPCSISVGPAAGHKLTEDDNLPHDMNTDDDLFLGWFDGSMPQMSESWLAWVNFT